MAEIGVLHLAFTILQWSLGAIIWLVRALLRVILGLLDLARSILEIAAWSIGALDHAPSPTARPAPSASARWRVHAAWR